MLKTFSIVFMLAVVGIISGLGFSLYQWLFFHWFVSPDILAVGGNVLFALVMVYFSTRELSFYDGSLSMEKVPFYILPFMIAAGFAGFYMANVYTQPNHLLFVSAVAALTCALCGFYIRRHTAILSVPMRVR